MNGHWPGRQHPDCPVTDLPPVAIRAVQHVTAPPFLETFDRWKLIGQPGGYQQAPGRHRPPISQNDVEPVSGGAGGDDFPARDCSPVASYFLPALGKEFPGAHSVPGQESMNAGRGGVSGCSGVNDEG